MIIIPKRQVALSSMSEESIASAVIHHTTALQLFHNVNAHTEVCHKISSPLSRPLYSL